MNEEGNDEDGYYHSDWNGKTKGARERKNPEGVRGVKKSSLGGASEKVNLLWKKTKQATGKNGVRKKGGREPRGKASRENGTRKTG